MKYYDLILYLILGFFPCSFSFAQSTPEKSTSSITNPTVFVCIQPLGRYKPKLIQSIEKGIHLLYGFQTKILQRRTHTGQVPLT